MLTVPKPGRWYSVVLTVPFVSCGIRQYSRHPPEGLIAVGTGQRGRHDGRYPLPLALCPLRPAPGRTPLALSEHLSTLSTSGTFAVHCRVAHHLPAVLEQDQQCVHQLKQRAIEVLDPPTVKGTPASTRAAPRRQPEARTWPKGAAVPHGAACDAPLLMPAAVHASVRCSAAANACGCACAAASVRCSAAANAWGCACAAASVAPLRTLVCVGRFGWLCLVGCLPRRAVRALADRCVLHGMLHGTLPCVQQPSCCLVAVPLQVSFYAAVCMARCLACSFTRAAGASQRVLGLMDSMPAIDIHACDPYRRSLAGRTLHGARFSAMPRASNRGGEGPVARPSPAVCLSAAANPCRRCAATSGSRTSSSRTRRGSTRSCVSVP